MDLQTIKDNIEYLESQETTVDNVQDLANLYTVYDRLKYKHPLQNNAQEELNDLMPAYSKYVDTKRQCQMGQATEEAVEHTLKLLTQELKEFIETLYSNTTCRRERLNILYLVKELDDKYNK